MSTPRSRRYSPRSGTRTPAHRTTRVRPWRASTTRTGRYTQLLDRHWTRVVGASLLLTVAMTVGALALDLSLLGDRSGDSVDIGPAAGSGVDSATAGGSGDAATTVIHTFSATADAYVNSDKPDFNYGDALTLRIDQDPEVRSYLAFDVRGIDGPVQRATIELFVTSASSQGFLVQPLPPEATWSEGSIDHHAAPLPNADDTKTVQPFAQQTWVQVDVTDLITGDGVYGFALSGISRTAVSVGSRESDRPPKLTIETARAQ